MLQQTIKRFPLFLFLILAIAAQATPGDYVKTKDGIIVYTDPALSGNTQAVQLQVVRNNIIRVLATAEKNFSTEQSLITVYEKDPAVKWSVTSSKDVITLKTSLVTALVQIKTGVVSFYDATGKRLL